MVSVITKVTITEKQIMVISTDVENKNQLDATEWFIARIIRSTCFGHFYAHHEEL